MCLPRVCPLPAPLTIAKFHPEGVWGSCHRSREAQKLDWDRVCTIQKVGFPRGPWPKFISTVWALHRNVQKTYTMHARLNCHFEQFHPTVHGFYRSPQWRSRETIKPGFDFHSNEGGRTYHINVHEKQQWRKSTQLLEAKQRIDQMVHPVALQQTDPRPMK